MPAGTGQAHLALTAQVTNLVAEIVQEHEKGPYMPGIIASCSKELMRVRSMTPGKICAWEALGDHSGDLPVMPNPSIGPITVDLPSPPVIAGNVAGSSTHATSELRTKEKSAKKGCKRVKATCNVKPKVFVESEDDEDTIVQPISSEVPALNVPWPSTIVVGTPHSPKQQLFGPASLIAGSPPKVMATSGSPLEVVETPRQCPALRRRNLQSLIQVIFSFPAQTTPAIIAPRRSGPAPLGWTGGPVPHVCPSMGSPPKRIRGKSTTQQTHSRTPSRAPSNALAASQSKAQTRSQSRGPSSTPAVPAVTTPKAQSRGRSKTITAPKTPAPAPATIPSSSTAVPRPALDVPIPDLHSMAIAIWDGAARIALLEACVAEQDGKIDTLQRLHEGLCRKVIDQHPSFPLPDSPVNATFLLDQSVPLSISPLPSALAPLIDLDMAGMEPLPPKVQPASVIEGLIFELSQIQPEGPQTSGKIVDPDDPGNLVPEYDSDDMDVEVKVEPSADEGEMAT
ncbi:hypothetical protein BDR07DRAFT_1494956 [Suillus spraguei]|nr:hypothetical protein BDR07DRAFT_1494956 [Suillus spraguei]